MNISLEQLYEKLKQVRAYLIKIGPSRREGRILETKLKEANNIQGVLFTITLNPIAYTL